MIASTYFGIMIYEGMFMIFKKSKIHISNMTVRRIAENDGNNRA